MIRVCVCVCLQDMSTVWKPSDHDKNAFEGGLWTASQADLIFGSNSEWLPAHSSPHPVSTAALVEDSRHDAAATSFPTFHAGALHNYAH